MRCEWNLSPAHESALTSVVFLGTMVGSYLWGALSDAKGRRLGFASTAGCIFFFGAASALAPNFAVLYALGLRDRALLCVAWEERPRFLE